MNYKNQLKTLILILVYIMSNNVQASTNTEEKSPSNTKKNTNKTAEIMIPSLFGLGTGALTIWAGQKSKLVDLYLQWRGAENWSDSKALEEGLFYHGVGVPTVALGTGTLAFWAAHKAYRSKRASSWRERFWNWWYNRKPTQQPEKLTTEKPTIN